MELFVKLVGRKDLSGEIYRQLRRAIADGRLRPGDRLPPSRELAHSVEVSRMTVTVVYDRLAGEGFVTSRIGAGTYGDDSSPPNCVPPPSTACTGTRRVTRPCAKRSHGMWRSPEAWTPRRTT